MWDCLRTFLATLPEHSLQGAVTYSRTTSLFTGFDASRTYATSPADGGRCRPEVGGPLLSGRRAQATIGGRRTFRPARARFMCSAVL